MQEELDGIDGDSTGTLEDLLRLFLMNEECANRKVISLMLESLLEILIKRRSQSFYKPIDVHSVTNAVGEGISSISTSNTVNQSGKFFFLVGW